MRGFRIEPGEIEAALLGHAAVQESVVVAQGSGGDKRLVAYLQVREGRVPDSDELRSYLQEQLPAYLIPSAFVVLEQWPLTATGKVDLRALPVLANSGSDFNEVYVAPRTELERIITGLWKKTLGIDKIGIHDDFFELGGNSMKAAVFINHLQKALDENILVVSLFKARNIASLASYLTMYYPDAVSGIGKSTSRNLTEVSSHAAPPNQIESPLVEIQPKGSKRPLFCVHAIGGHAYGYTELARYLGLDQPVYGFHAPGLGGEQEPHTQITDMATQYIEALKAIQPEGPYAIGGYSFGCLVAFEMAQQLRRQGNKLALVALFDGHIKALGEMREQAGELDNAMLLGEMFGIPSDALNEIRQLEPDEQLIAIMDLLKSSNKVPSDFELSHSQAHNLLRVLKANMKAAANYVPQPYSGQLTLFRASEQPPNLVNGDPTFGWGKLATEGVRVYEVPGNHLTMVTTPHVQVLAARLKTCLDETDAAHAQT